MGLMAIAALASKADLPYHTGGSAAAALPLSKPAKLIHDLSDQV